MKKHTNFIKLAYTEHKDDAQFLEKYVYFLLEEGKREEAQEVVADYCKNFNLKIVTWFEMFE